MFRLLGWSLVAMFILVSCVPSVSTKQVERGIISGNFDIKAVDNSFHLKAGERFEPPFQSNYYACYYNGGHPEGCSISRGEQIETSDISDLKRIGGQAVIIDLPNTQEDLYGILVLFEAIDDSDSLKQAGYSGFNTLAANSYQIQLTSSNIQLARNGGLAKNYEILAQRTGRVLPSWLILYSNIPLD